MRLFFNNWIDINVFVLSIESSWVKIFTNYSKLGVTKQRRSWTVKEGAGTMGHNNLGNLECKKQSILWESSDTT